MLKKTIQWSITLSLVAGLSSCFMYDQSSRNETMQGIIHAEKNPAKHTTSKEVKDFKETKTVAKARNSATEPVQKSTPGPKRTAAPQLPVLQ